MLRLAPEPDVAEPDALASQRHRPARTASFPAGPGLDYDAREIAYLRWLLVDPLRALAGRASDPGARAIAEAALAPADATEDSVAEHARLEYALERIAAAAADDAARAGVEEALALYRDR